MSALNLFSRKSTELDSPARNAIAITPDDTNELPNVARWLYVGSDGDVTLILEKDTTPILLKGLKAGSLLNLCVKQVMATGTTLNISLVALF